LLLSEREGATELFFLFKVGKAAYTLKKAFRARLKAMNAFWYSGILREDSLFEFIDILAVF
jgi:hypothetical protein